MEVSNEVEHKGCSVLSNGPRHSVSSVPSKGNQSVVLIYLRTGACCIVRTVLNYQSLPTDTTCKVPFVHHQSEKLTNKRRWHFQLVLENVSTHLLYMLSQLTPFWQFRGTDGYHSGLRSNAPSGMEMGP